MTTSTNETASWPWQSVVSLLTIKTYPILKTNAGFYFPIVNAALTLIPDGQNESFGDPAQFPMQSFEFNNHFVDIFFTPKSTTFPPPAGCLQKLVSVDGSVAFVAYRNLNKAHCDSAQHFG